MVAVVWERSVAEAFMKDILYGVLVIRVTYDIAKFRE